MIYTRFGSKVREILGYEEESGTVRYIRESDGVERFCHIADLKADGGAPEILTAVKSRQGTQTKLGKTPD